MSEVIVVTQTVVILGGLCVWDEPQTCPVLVVVVCANPTELRSFVLKILNGKDRVY